MTEKEKLVQSLIEDGYLKTPAIIDAFREIDRADFVLSEYKNQAYGNYPLSIGRGQTISQPLTVAFMLELLDPKPGEKILDIGAGSGWQAALLAYCVSQKETQGSKFKVQNPGKVMAVERILELCEFAKKNIEKYGFINSGAVDFRCVDATSEILEGPYDKIIAAAAASNKIPEVWRKNLKIGGKIVAPVGGSIWLFIKKSAVEWEEKEFQGFVFVPLVSDESSKLKTQNLKPQPKSKNLFVLLAISLFLFGGLLVNEVYRPHVSYPNSQSLEISAGFGSRKIGELLKKNGIIRSKWIFVAYVWLKGLAANLKPGEYVFDKAAIPEVVSTLARGGENEIVITIPEGWTTKDIAQYLEKEKIVADADFLKFTSPPLAEKFAERFDFLGSRSSGIRLEGFLFPDTYRIFKNASSEDIIYKTLENFEKKVMPETRKDIVRPGNIFQIVTVASLIEKEVVSDEDRKIVSGILWKRLELGIPLQVDATITYITGKKTTRISLDDLKIDSPYNTYKYAGLPLGPISNPGLSAIKAAASPHSSPYLYYLSTLEGKTIFSKTLEEHNLAKARYLK